MRITKKINKITRLTISSKRNYWSLGFPKRNHSPNKTVAGASRGYPTNIHTTKRSFTFFRENWKYISKSIIDIQKNVMDRLGKSAFINIYESTRAMRWNINYGRVSCGSMFTMVQFRYRIRGGYGYGAGTLPKRSGEVSKLKGTFLGRIGEVSKLKGTFLVCIGEVSKLAFLFISQLKRSKCVTSNPLIPFSLTSKIMASQEHDRETAEDQPPLWGYVTKLEKLSGTGGGCGVSICKKPTKTEKREMKQLDDEYDKKKAESQAKEVQLPCEAGGRFKKRKGISTPIEKAFGVEIRDQLDQEIARMFYTGGLPFNLARNPNYVRAFQFAATNKIDGYVPPGYNKLRTTLLQKEKDHVHKLLEPLRSTWKDKGVSIVSDGWSDPTRKPLINFIATSCTGPLFLKAVNCFGEVKDRNFIANLMKEVINEIGHQNAAGEIIESQFPHIFWTPCVVHTLNLALKNICSPRNVETNQLTYAECSWIKVVHGEALEIKNFIMNHNMRLSIFSKFTPLRLLSVADTRFASIIVMLKRLKLIKRPLQSMVISDEWSSYRLDDSQQANHVKEYILNDEWWDQVSYILSFTGPIYEMIRVCDTDKPSLHLVYEMWDSMIEKVKFEIYKKENRPTSQLKSRSFENSYIPENPRTPKPLTFSKNRLRGAKNRSNLRLVAKKNFRKNNFFFSKSLHICKKKIRAYVHVLRFCFKNAQIPEIFLKFFYRSLYTTYLKVEKKYRFFGNFFQRILFILNVLEGSEVGFLKGITDPPLYSSNNTSLGHPPILTTREDGLAEGGVTAWWWLGDVGFVNKGNRRCAGGTESGDDDWGDGGRRLVLEEDAIWKTKDFIFLEKFGKLKQPNAKTENFSNTKRTLRVSDCQNFQMDLTGVRHNQSPSSHQELEYGTINRRVLSFAYHRRLQSIGDNQQSIDNLLPSLFTALRQSIDDLLPSLFTASSIDREYGASLPRLQAFDIGIELLAISDYMFPNFCRFVPYSDSECFKISKTN
ncbi:hypothetical protein LXL04_015689 [Taraxacum kok-saghyz]